MTGAVLVAGAGIAGLTAALALAARGMRVRVFERATSLEAVGAGIQLSPNATRILTGLGLGDRLRRLSVQPETVRLRDGHTLKPLGEVRLGAWAEERWAAPYLVLARSDLQHLLLAATNDQPLIEMQLGARVSSVSHEGDKISLEIGWKPDVHTSDGSFLVAADGVSSEVRSCLWLGAKPAFTGLIAWRAMVPPAQASDPRFAEILSPTAVSAVLLPSAHLVAYPMRNGAFNLVAFAVGEAGGKTSRNVQQLKAAFARADDAIRTLVGQDGWSDWPLRVAPAHLPFTFGERCALIGDAAHAMMPFAAQGAAMAIEDAASLAALFHRSVPTRAALLGWERARQARVARVARRGRLNRLAWHASGPVAWARDALLRRRSPERLAADLDWLYRWRFEDAKPR